MVQKWQSQDQPRTKQHKANLFSRMESGKRCCIVLFRQVYYLKTDERQPTKRQPMESSRRISFKDRLVPNKQLDRLLRLGLQVQGLGLLWKKSLLIRTIRLRNQFRIMEPQRRILCCWCIRHAQIV